MMNVKQYYLTKLAEECSEVAQIALKTQQFGFDECYPGQPFTNAQRIHQELDDLMAIVEELNEEYGLGYVMNRDAINAKKAKVSRYLDYSQKLGEVSE